MFVEAESREWKNSDSHGFHELLHPFVCLKFKDRVRLSENMDGILVPATADESAFPNIRNPGFKQNIEPNLWNINYN